MVVSAHVAVASGGQIAVQIVLTSGGTPRFAAAETFDRVADEQPTAHQQVAKGRVG